MNEDTKLLFNNCDFVKLDDEIYRMCLAIKEKGYNVESQIVGYILSKDPIYITNNLNARQIISRHTVDEILQYFVRYYLIREFDDKKSETEKNGEKNE